MLPSVGAGMGCAWHVGSLTSNVILDGSHPLLSCCPRGTNILTWPCCYCRSAGVPAIRAPRRRGNTQATHKQLTPKRPRAAQASITAVLSSSTPALSPSLQDSLCRAPRARSDLRFRLSENLVSFLGILSATTQDSGSLRILCRMKETKDPTQESGLKTERKQGCEGLNSRLDLGERDGFVRLLWHLRQLRARNRLRLHHRRGRRRDA
jgi:hypothetical protein